MKKDSNSLKQSEAQSKRRKSGVVVERKPQDVMAELVARLAEQLDVTIVPAVEETKGDRDRLRPNLDRLTVGGGSGGSVEQLLHFGFRRRDAGRGSVSDKEARDCGILSRPGDFPGSCRSRNPFSLGAGNHRRFWTRSAGSKSPADGRIETSPAQERPDRCREAGAAGKDRSEIAASDSAPQYRSP